VLPGLNNGHVIDASVDATAQWKCDKRKEAHDAQCKTVIRRFESGLAPCSVRERGFFVLV
jgi:hypothetical protein